MPKLFQNASTLRFFKNEAGFTLLEVMIAMTIMVLCMASIFQISSTSIGAIEKVKNFNTIAILARNLMQKTEFEIEGKPFAEVTKESEGGFEGQFQDFRWKREIKEIEFPNLASLGAAAGGGEGESGGSGGDSGGGGGNSDVAGMIGKNVTEFLSKSIREITITIFWKRAGGELKYSVSTYWVDLNHEFSLSQ